LGLELFCHFEIVKLETMFEINVCTKL